MNAYINNKQLNNIYKYNRIMLFEFIILIYLFINAICEPALRKLDLDSEITIVINGTGTQQILSDVTNAYHGYTDYKMPYQILVNGVLQNYTKKYVYNLTNQINKIP